MREIKENTRAEIAEIVESRTPSNFRGARFVLGSRTRDLNDKQSIPRFSQEAGTELSRCTFLPILINLHFEKMREIMFFMFINNRFLDRFRMRLIAIVSILCFFIIYDLFLRFILFLGNEFSKTVVPSIILL